MKIAEVDSPNDPRLRVWSNKAQDYDSIFAMVVHIRNDRPIIDNNLQAS